MKILFFPGPLSILLAFQAATTTTQATQASNSSSSRVYVSGAVKFDSGGAPPTHVVIERDCAGVVRQEALTDSSGNFSFLLGGPAGITDASIGEDLSVKVSSISTNVPDGTSERSLVGCEVRAKLAGYVSDSIQIGFRRALDSPNIGLIYLHAIERSDGQTFSVTTALAPKNAQKAYEKGLAGMKKQKWADAEKDLKQAVSLYPRYAVAWHELGRAQELQKNPRDASLAYTKAVEIDPEFTAPYVDLAVLALTDKKWDAAALYSSKVIRQNSNVAPDIYYYSAFANYNLHNVDIAEGHAREAASLDSRHRNPKINYLLGVILAQKQDYAAAAEQLRTYLKFSPAASDTEAVTKLLSQVEARSLGTDPKSANPH